MPIPRRFFSGSATRRKEPPTPTYLNDGSPVLQATTEASQATPITSISGQKLLLLNQFINAIAALTN